MNYIPAHTSVGLVWEVNPKYQSFVHTDHTLKQVCEGVWTCRHYSNGWKGPSTLLTRAGNPCCEVLNEYKRINYLNIIFQEVYATPESMELKAIQVSTITGKAIQIHLYNSNYDYVLKQPNNYEHH